MTEHAPAITVLMSVYNSKRWLTEAINSVLNQTFSDFEFIIIDDGSTDQSPGIIAKFAATDSRIRVITKKNTGLADSLNVGIQHARGEWVARLDADDICLPGRLKIQHKLAIGSRDIVFVGGGAVAIEADGSVQGANQYPCSHYRLLRRLRTLGGFVPHSTAFFRRSAVLSIGGYRTVFHRAQDYDLWLRLIEIGRFTASNEPLIYYRTHENMISNDQSGRTSITYGWIAVTCYWIRKLGHSDNFIMNEQIFLSFKDFITHQLHDNGIFESHQFVRELKKAMQSDNSLMAVGLSACKIVANNTTSLMHYAAYRLVKRYRSDLIARKWLGYASRNGMTID